MPWSPDPIAEAGARMEQLVEYVDGQPPIQDIDARGPDLGSWWDREPERDSDPDLIQLLWMLRAAAGLAIDELKQAQPLRVDPEIVTGLDPIASIEEACGAGLAAVLPAEHVYLDFAGGPEGGVRLPPGQQLGWPLLLGAACAQIPGGPLTVIPIGAIADGTTVALGQSLFDDTRERGESFPVNPVISVYGRPEVGLFASAGADPGHDSNCGAFVANGLRLLGWILPVLSGLSDGSIEIESASPGVPASARLRGGA